MVVLGRVDAYLSRHVDGGLPLYDENVLIVVLYLVLLSILTGW
jgi:hypothetical protein